MSLFSSIRGIVSTVFVAVGAVAGVVAKYAPVPMWAKTALKVVSIAAPAIGAVVAISECVDNTSGTSKPKSITEKTLKNRKTDEFINYLELDNDEFDAEEATDEAYDEVISDEDVIDSIRKPKAKKRSRNRGRGIHKAVSDRLSDIGGTCEDVAFGYVSDKQRAS